MLKNLELQRTEVGLSNTDKALIDFKIGRLHAMSYALKTEQAATDAAAYPGSRFELPDFGHTPDHIQFNLKSGDKTKNAAAGAHLKLAVKALENAMRVAPDLLAGQLGLAWCLDQSGAKDKARELYRKVFREAFEQEQCSSGGVYNWSIAAETAEYLRKLLDPVKNAKELEDIKEKTATLNKLPRYVTPVVVPLVDCATETTITRPARVTFDLDGQGKRQYCKWVSPSAGWLVFDCERQSRIESGLQLIGSVTFWLFWRNGYEVLSALDNNRDGLLNGCELDKLAIWQDKNTNGVSDPGEVKPLAAWGIRALSTKGVQVSHDLFCCKKGAQMLNGRWRPTWDVVLHPQ